MARPSSAPEPSHPSGGMELQSAGYTIVWDAYDQAVISHQRRPVPLPAQTCATSPTMRDHRRVHGCTSYEALPQYRMWYLRFPTSLTGICSLERQASAFLPGEHSFVRPRYIYLSRELVVPKPQPSEYDLEDDMHQH